MKKALIFILFAICGFAFLPAQTAVKTEEEIAFNLGSQVLTYPQEKIYLQTDRPCYISGEKIFFRAFLLHASLNRPLYMSRYMYVELINPLNEAVIRQQIRLEEDKMFYGVLTLPEELPEGNYRIRAYTRYMENMGEESFYNRSVFIADPNAAKTELETNFEFTDKQVTAGFRFKDRKTGEIRFPELVELQVNNDKKKTEVKPGSEGWSYAKFSLKEDDEQRALFLECTDGSNSFGKYIRIPYRNNQAEISFYPEGGNLVAGETNRIAFKALFPGGGAAGVEGSVYDSKGELQTSFNTRHEGMGDFFLEAKTGETYYAQYTYENRTIKTNLPAVKNDALALQAVWKDNGLSVSVRKPGGSPNPKTYLLIHRQGIPAVFEEWDFATNQKLYPEERFGTGVSHLMLLDENLHPLSERLVFNNRNDNLTANIQTDKESYKAREKVQLDILLSETDTIPANFAISVTDDKDVKLDTSTNIMAEILLVSELKGRIDNPAYYFGERGEASKNADLLMLTHGWRNYHVSEALAGNIQKPAIQAEQSQSFSGYLKTPRGKPAKGGFIKMTVPGELTEAVEVNDEGYYRFDSFEFPDSTLYQFHANTKDRKTDIEIHEDEIVFPKISIYRHFGTTEPDTDKADFLAYISKAEQKYVSENGVRMINLPEVEVKGRRKIRKRIDNNLPIKSEYWISPEEIEEYPPVAFDDLIFRLRRGQLIADDGTGPQLAINGAIFHGTYQELQHRLHIDDVAQVEYFTELAQVLIFSSELGHVIAFTTWPPGYGRNKEKAKTHIATLLPLGYQKPVEFYSPKYDTPEALNDPSPDLRSTIYWKPNMITNNNGNTSVDFYAADAKTSYSVVIEGVGNNRQLIYCRKEGLIKVE